MIPRIVYRSILAALLLGAVAAALLAALKRPSEQMVIQAGDVGPFLADGETARLRNFFGFNAPEPAGAVMFRWTTGEGSFVVRDGARLGQPLLLDLRVCGCRAAAGPPARLRLRVDGATLAETTATAGWDQWRHYRLLVPPRAAPYHPDLLIELLSDHVPNAETGAPLGVAFDRAALAPLAGATHAYDPPEALGLGLLVGTLALVARARGASAGRAALVAALGLGLAVAQGLLYRHQALPASVLALGLLVSLGLALALADAPAVAALALLMGALVLATQALGVWMLDDAFISFRYARNALMGHGFVFNPGERVEGYTNFLWTALFVPILGAGAPPALASQAITLLLAPVTVGLTWAGARRLAGRWSSLGAVALLAAAAPFVLYTARGSGMETALFTLLLLGGALAYLSGRHSLAGLLLALAAMTRPEGLLVAAVSGLHLLVRSRRVGRIAWRPLAALAAGFLAIFAPYYVWRLLYYGYPLPNTFYAKVGGTLAQVLRGLDYAARFGASQAPLLALAALGVALIGRPSPPTPLPLRRERGAVVPPLSLRRERGAVVPPLLPQRERGSRRSGGCTVYHHQHPPTYCDRVRDVSDTSTPSERNVANIGHDDGKPPGVEDGKQYSGGEGQLCKSPAQAAGYLAALVGAYTLYIVSVGGDHFPLYRFFVPLLPPLALLAAFALDRVGAALPGRAGAATLALLAAAGVAWQLPQLYDSRTLNTAGQVWGENSVVEKNREIGLWLRANTPPGTLIATGIAGALPYYAERPVLDSLGLNDLHIAHLDVPAIGQGVAGSEKTDVAYVLGRHPDYIPHNSSGPFVGDPTFAATYKLFITRGTEGRGLRLYRRAGVATPGTAHEAAP